MYGHYRNLFRREAEFFREALRNRKIRKTFYLVSS
jgi:hypothetical protein